MKPEDFPSRLQSPSDKPCWVKQPTSITQMPQVCLYLPLPGPELGTPLLEVQFSKEEWVGKDRGGLVQTPVTAACQGSLTQEHPARHSPHSLRCTVSSLGLQPWRDGEKMLEGTRLTEGIPLPKEP